MPTVTYYLPENYGKREKEILEAASPEGSKESLPEWERGQIKRWLQANVGRYQKWEIEGEWLDLRFGVPRRYVVTELPAATIPVDMAKTATSTFKRVQMLSGAQVEWSRKIISLVRGADRVVSKKEKLPAAMSYYEALEKTVGGVFARHIIDAATQLLTQKAMKEIEDEKPKPAPKPTE